MLNFKTAKEIELFLKARKFRDGGEFNDALDAYRTCQDTAADLGDKVCDAYCFHEIGLVYSRQKRFEEALTSYERALRIFTALKDAIMRRAVTRDMALERLAIFEKSKADLPYSVANELLRQGVSLLKKSVGILSKADDRDQEGISRVKLVKPLLIRAGMEPETLIKLGFLQSARKQFLRGFAMIDGKSFFAAIALADLARIAEAEKHAALDWAEEIFGDIEKSEGKEFRDKRNEINRLRNS